LPNGPTNYCTINFTVLGALPAAGAPDEVLPITIQNDLWGDGGGNPVSGNTTTSGEVRLMGAAPDVVLGFTPASAVAFPGGTSGTPTTASIAVSVDSGSIGTGTVSNCVIGGTNASAFSVT